MPEYIYKVIVDGKVYADDMTLETALTLTEALFNKWYSEDNLAITIQRTEVSHTISVMEDKIEVADTKLC